MSASNTSSTLGTLSRAETVDQIRNKNAEVVKEITTGDFEEGGVLNRQQFAEFYQEVQDQVVALDMARTVPVDGPQSQIDKIGVERRQLRSVGEAEAADLRSISTGKVDIDVEKVSLPYELTRETVEDTIEEENTSEIILNQFSQQFAVDLEDLAFNGDTDYDAGEEESEEDEAFLTINDGWLKIAEDRGAHDVDHGNESVDNDVFTRLAQAVPDRYKSSMDLVFFMSMNQALEYKNYLADRDTSLGDQSVTDGTFTTPLGYDVVMSPVMPHDKILFCDPQNLVHAVHRDTRVGVTMDSERVVMNDLYAQYNLTSRFDFQIEDENGVAYAENLESPWE